LREKHVSKIFFSRVTIVRKMEEVPKLKKVKKNEFPQFTVFSVAQNKVPL